MSLETFCSAKIMEINNTANNQIVFLPFPARFYDIRQVCIQQEQKNGSPFRSILFPNKTTAADTCER